MMMSEFVDDLRQTGVVMNQEFRKYLRGKKLIGFILLIVIIHVLIYSAYTLSKMQFPSESKDFISLYMSLIKILAIVAVAVFSSSLLVSEYEERTGLLLVTRPIKKGTIFAGKFLAGFLISALMIVIYYLIVVIMSYTITGTVYGKIWASLGLVIAYIFGATGIALLLSACCKKSNTATSATIIVLLIVGAFVSQLFSGNGIEPWFSITYSSGSITTILNGASTAVVYVDPIRTAWYFVADPALSAMVMAAWGVFTSYFASMIYKRRGF